MFVGLLLLSRTLSLLAALQSDAQAEGVQVLASEVQFVQATHLETVVRGRPWVPFRRVATLSRGTRLVVRGQVESRDAKGCHGKPWYATYPFGFVCSEHVRPSKQAPEPGVAMPPLPGKRLPHAYVVVREDGVAAFANEDEVLAGTPSRHLVKNMSLVVQHSRTIDGRDFIVSADGTLVPRDGVGWMGQGAEFHGVVLSGFERGPAFAWTKSTSTPIRPSPDSRGEPLEKLPLRTRVPLLEVAGSRDDQFWRVGPDRWIAAEDLNRVMIIDPPPGVLHDPVPGELITDQWIDVDVGQQVLVAYRGHRPVFATLVASGKASPTPLGNYPVWAKVASMDMANQDYEDKPYLVQGVPWVLLFQGHNAIHGAYWHDRFGNRRSHGCVNLAPRDAHWVFDWLGPTLPRGWTGYLPGDLQRSPVVHVRDSSRPEALAFTQERPIGPPDREEEQRRSEAATARREADAARAALEADMAQDVDGDEALRTRPLWPEDEE